jgi:hypothetical protein
LDSRLVKGVEGTVLSKSRVSFIQMGVNVNYLTDLGLAEPHAYISTR